MHALHDGGSAGFSLSGAMGVMQAAGLDMSAPYGAWPTRDSGFTGSAYLGAGADLLPLRSRHRPLPCPWASASSSATCA